MLLDKLDKYYELVTTTLLRHQSPCSGLVGDGRVGFVRDTIYTAACAWALSLGYRKVVRSWLIFTRIILFLKL